MRKRLAKIKTTITKEDAEILFVERIESMIPADTARTLNTENNKNKNARTKNGNQVQTNMQNIDRLRGEG
jgi:hypothetical protein